MDKHDQFCFIIYDGPCTCGLIDQQFYDQGYEQGWIDCWKFLQDFLSPTQHAFEPPPIPDSL